MPLQQLLHAWRAIKLGKLLVDLLLDLVNLFVLFMDAVLKLLQLVLLCLGLFCFFLLLGFVGFRFCFQLALEFLNLLLVEVFEFLLRLFGVLLLLRFLFLLFLLLLAGLLLLLRFYLRFLFGEILLHLLLLLFLALSLLFLLQFFFVGLLLLHRPLHTCQLFDTIFASLVAKLFSALFVFLYFLPQLHGLVDHLRFCITSRLTFNSSATLFHRQEHIVEHICYLLAEQLILVRNLRQSELHAQREVFLFHPA